MTLDYKVEVNSKEGRGGFIILDITVDLEKYNINIPVDEDYHPPKEVIEDLAASKLSEYIMGKMELTIEDNIEHPTKHYIFSVKGATVSEFDILRAENNGLSNEVKRLSDVVNYLESKLLGYRTLSFWERLKFLFGCYKETNG